jgi:hypothetical protein
MELVVAVAIGVLTMIFIGSLIALLLVCRHRYCFQHQLDQKPILKYSKDNLEAAGQDLNSNEYELDDVLQLSPNIEKVLKDNDWINDTTGLVQHCLAILKSCHSVTDKLSGLSFSPVHGDQELMDEVRRATSRVMPRVDDLVRAMYTGGRKGVQAPLLEARAAALVLAINNLVLAFRSAYAPRRAATTMTTGNGASTSGTGGGSSSSGSSSSTSSSSYPDWLRAALLDMECQLAALRDAAQTEEQQQFERVEFFPAGTSPVRTTTANDLVSTASL